MNNTTKSNENKIQHLQMIQDIITRMANNSFAIKKWLIVILGVVITTLATKQTYINGKLIVTFCLCITGIFWLYDAFYLYQERKFRNLYDEVLEKKDRDIDFKMITPCRESYWSVVVRPVLIALYGSMILFMVISLFFI